MNNNYFLQHEKNKRERTERVAQANYLVHWKKHPNVQQEWHLPSTEISLSQLTRRYTHVFPIYPSFHFTHKTFPLQPQPINNQYHAFTMGAKLFHITILILGPNCRLWNEQGGKMPLPISANPKCCVTPASQAFSPIWKDFAFLVFTQFKWVSFLGIH